MFSTEKKIMLCINCFRDMKKESRSHCMDLETAYKQGCIKLDRSVQAIRELQNSVRDGILLLRSLVGEIGQNAETEKEAITNLYECMQEKIAEKKLVLLEEVEKQYRDKEKLFRDQLIQLNTILPTLQINLVICSAFSSSANKYEFLDLAYILMERLTMIARKKHPLHPTQGSQINTDHKSQFAKCLEPLLFPAYSRDMMSSPNSFQQFGRSNGNNNSGPSHSSSSGSINGSSSPGGYNFTHNSSRRSNNGKVKFIDAKGQFAEHCLEFETSHRDMLQCLEKLKGQVQELHRDLTMRRCLAKRNQVAELTNIIATIEDQLQKHNVALEQKQPTLEKHWEESLLRIANEQDLYQAQLNDVTRLKQESQHLKVILTQLSSFVNSISSVSERIAPKLNQSSQNQENQMHAIFEQISIMQPDSQQRVDAITTAQDERQTQLANQTNPLDDALIKTKGLLKAPSARREPTAKNEPPKSPVEDKPLIENKSPIELEDKPPKEDILPIEEEDDNMP